MFELIVLIENGAKKVTDELVAPGFYEYLYELDKEEIDRVVGQVHAGEISELMELRNKALSFFYQVLDEKCETAGLDLNSLLK